MLLLQRPHKIVGEVDAEAPDRVTIRIVQQDHASGPILLAQSACAQEALHVSVAHDGAAELPRCKFAPQGVFRPKLHRFGACMGGSRLFLYDPADPATLFRVRTVHRNLHSSSLFNSVSAITADCFDDPGPCGRSRPARSVIDNMHYTQEFLDLLRLVKNSVKMARTTFRLFCGRCYNRIR